MRRESENTNQKLAYFLASATTSASNGGAVRKVGPICAGCRLRRLFLFLEFLVF